MREENVKGSLKPNTVPANLSAEANNAGRKKPAFNIRIPITISKHENEVFHSPRTLQIGELL